MLKSAAEWLAAVLSANEGIDATYTRVGSPPITTNKDGTPFQVIPGRVRPERFALADGRVNLEVEPADFLVMAEAIDFGSGPVEPQTGDRITLSAFGLADRVYELMPRDGEPAWRPLTQYPAELAGGAAARCPMYRLRTIRVKAGP